MILRSVSSKASAPLRGIKRTIRSSAKNVSINAIPGIVEAGILAAISGVPLSAVFDDIKDDGSKVRELANKEITSAEGTTLLYIAYPPNFNPETDQAPVVVLVHEFFGLLPREVQLAEELAKLGFVAVAVDTFKGKSTSLVPRAIALVYQNALKPGATWGREAIEGTVSYIRGKPWCSGKVGIVGWCYGGGAAVRYTLANPGDVDGCFVFYGKPPEPGTITRSDSRAPIYGVYGDKDQQFSKASLESFKQELLENRVLGGFSIYPGQGHAFMRDASATKQRGSAAEQAWNECVSFFRRALMED